MNIYDTANELARGLGESHEYQEFLKAKQAIAGDEQGKQMVQAILSKQMELGYAQMSGQEEDKDQMAQLQQMVSVASANTAVRDFLLAHMRFQQMMNDVSKILGASVAEGMNFFAK